MRQPVESRRSHMPAPSLPIVKRSAPVAAPALLPLTSRVRAEEHAARFQGRVQFTEHPRQHLAGHVEQHRIREDAVLASVWQIQCQEVLLQDRASAVRSRQRGQIR